MYEFFKEKQELLRFLLDTDESRRGLCNELLAIAQQEYGATAQNVNLVRWISWAKEHDDPEFQSAPKWAKAAALTMALKRGYTLNTLERANFAVHTYLSYHAFLDAKEGMKAIQAALPIPAEFLSEIEKKVTEHVEYHIRKAAKRSRV